MRIKALPEDRLSSQVFCPVERSFHHLRADFDQLIIDQTKYQEKARVAIDQVNAIYAEIGTIKEHTKYLSCLKEMADDLKSMKDTTFDAAIGRRHVPLSVFLIVVISICVLSVIVLAGKGYFKGTATGVEVDTR